MQPTDSAGRPVVAQEVETRNTSGAGLRIFQIASAIAGAVLFLVGLRAVFDVNFDMDLLDDRRHPARRGGARDDAR